MKNTKHLTLSLLLLLISFVHAQDSLKIISKNPLSIGDRVEVQSNIMGETRVLNIYLPNGYNQNNKKSYPVIYLLDGSIDEDFIHISGLVQFGSFSWINILPETIVVGIANIDRKRDFTFPTSVKKHQKEFPTTGASGKFIQFIEEELHPFIQSNYKTTRVNTIIGQSLGGLLATEILFTKPNLFDNYIIVSPSLWWNNESLLNDTPTPYTSSKSIYIAVGKEGAIMEREANALYKKLQSLQLENTTLFFQFFEKQNHGDVLHLAVYHAFEQIFKTAKE